MSLASWKSRSAEPLAASGPETCTIFSHIQGYIFGKPLPSEDARELAAKASVIPDGYQSMREPRQRLMRRAMASIDGKVHEVRLRNISVMGALVECSQAVAPGTRVAMDIVGAGPVEGIVRWASAGKFGLQFTDIFLMSRLAPKKQKLNDVQMLSPWYVDKKAAG